MELFGRKSHLGGGMDSGYYVDGVYFNEGEEKQLCEYLAKELEIEDFNWFHWEVLHAKEGDTYYYSTWYVDEGQGYEDGVYLLDGTKIPNPEHPNEFIEGGL